MTESSFFAPANAAGATDIIPVTKKTLKNWSEKQDAPLRRWIAAAGFTAEPGSFCLIPGKDHALSHVLAGIDEAPDLWAFAGLPSALPQGIYRLQGEWNAAEATDFALGWALGSYQFASYKKERKPMATLAMPEGANAAYVEAAAEAVTLARDLINTPANDMGPAELAAKAEEVARRSGAQYRAIVGEELLAQNYPAIHAVGRASSRPPCLIDLRWGNPDHPKVTLVGKGVCFDSGGLDIKSASGMKLMKKDMGGAAVTLALAALVMRMELPVNLRLLIPAVENSVSGDAFRPLDILRTRSGLTVEIGNTDAEGRLILCDALTEADHEEPDLLIDCATLTGAARTALGTDIPALFTPDDTLAAQIEKHSRERRDPLWRLPLWKPYREMLNSPVADLNNAPDSPYAGAVTAALYLKEFVTRTTAWAHIDMMAWNLTNRPGRPAGGEAMALRTLFALLAERYR